MERDSRDGDHAAIYPAVRGLGQRTVSLAADLERLDRYAAMHAVRILTNLTTWRHRGDRQSDMHPWRLVALGAESNLAVATGIDVPIR